MKDSTVVIIVGDHGFCTIHTVFRPNMLFKSLPARFIAAGGSAFLYTKEKNIKDIVKKVTDSLNTLPKDKRKLFRIVDRKELDKMGADSNAVMALAAVPGTVFSGAITKAKATNTGPGTSIQNNPLDGVFVPVTGGHHGYDPNIADMYTGFIAWGKAVNKGGHIKELTETDIAPLISTLLGIDFKTPDGKLINGIIKQ